VVFDFGVLSIAKFPIVSTVNSLRTTGIKLGDFEIRVCLYELRAKLMGIVGEIYKQGFMRQI